MANFYWLDRIQPEQRLLVGNKAFHLCQLLQKEYPVVPGFVISAHLLRRFLETIEWSVPLFADLTDSSLRLNIRDPKQLRDIAYQIRRTIESHPLPSEWIDELVTATHTLATPAVTLRASLAIQSDRSLRHLRTLNSVVHGKSSALLNMQVCGNNATELATGLKRLWAELFSARSLFYWQRMGIPLPQVNLAVLVQPLHPAIAAGSVHINQSIWQVQSTVGLGMAIAGGEVTPDLYQIDARNGMVKARLPGKKAVAYAVNTQPSDNSPDPRSAISLQYATGRYGDRPSPPLPDALTVSPSFPLAASLTSAWDTTTPPLHAYLLPETEQTTLSLTESDLEELIRLVQRLVVELETPLEIEWTLCQTSPHLLLTQVIPGSSTALRALPPSLSVERTAAANNMSDSRPDGELLVAGLAASSGRVFARARVILPGDEPPDALLPGTALVATTIPPGWLSLIKQAAAIVTEAGGMTSHSAIIAREVGVPAVMGATNITRQIHSGDGLLVDGTQGRVYWASGVGHHQMEPLSQQPPPPTQAAGSAPRSLSRSVVLPSINGVASLGDRPPIGTQLMVNLSQPESLERISGFLVDGIGLLRSELLLISLLGNQHPNVWIHQGHQTELVERLAEAVLQFAVALAPRPVFYRSLDLRSHEFQQLPGGEGLPPETNPMLGVRGTFSYVLNPTLFNLELRALAQVQRSGYDNIQLLLPFVRTVEEFYFCYRQAEQAGLTRNPHFQIRIMAEVPSILFLLPEYVKAGAKGIAIGTNDLTQLILGVDRDYGPLATAFDERHPAVKAAIAQLIRQAQQAGIPCSICGQAPVRYPELIPDLIRWGITTISVEPEALEATYQAIARAERQFLLENSRQQFDTT